MPSAILSEYQTEAETAAVAAEVARSSNDETQNGPDERKDEPWGDDE